MVRTELRFQCCGHTFIINGRALGAHGDHCLKCDTSNPDVETARVQ